MRPPPPLAVLLAAAPTAPGAGALLARAAAQAGDRPLRVLLSGAGLAWAGTPALAALSGRADLAVCSRNAREAGWTAADTPGRVRWSSVATWLGEVQREPRADLWVALP